MEKSAYETIWMTGERVQPWIKTLIINQGESAQKINYKYAVMDELKNELYYERDPGRFIEICDPNYYQGQLGNSGSNVQIISDSAFIVNGNIVIADSNYVGGFTFEKISEMGMAIGSYP